MAQYGFNPQLAAQGLKDVASINALNQQTKFQAEDQEVKRQHSALMNQINFSQPYEAQVDLIGQLPMETQKGLMEFYQKTPKDIRDNKQKLKEATKSFIVNTYGDVKDQASYDRVRSTLPQYLQMQGASVEDINSVLQNVPQEYDRDRVSMEWAAVGGPQNALKSGVKLSPGEVVKGVGGNVLLDGGQAPENYGSPYTVMEDGASRKRQITQSGRIRDLGEAPPPSSLFGTVPGAPMPTTPGEKEVDKKMAKEFVEYQAVGGFSDTLKQVSQLREVQKTLESGTDTISGPIIGSTPDAILKVVNPKALDTRELIEEVVQRNLRLILGAQFTEKEGERLIARAYNPNLAEKDNAKRVGRLIDQILAAARAKEDSMSYFQANGTLKGWQGVLPTVDDLIAGLDSESDVPKERAAKGGIPQNAAYGGVNPETGKTEYFDEDGNKVE